MGRIVLSSWCLDLIVKTHHVVVGHPFNIQPAFPATLLELAFHAGGILKADVARSVEWNDPFGGHCSDTFQVSADNQTLTQVTEMTMRSGKACTYRQAAFYHLSMPIQISSSSDSMTQLVLRICLPLHKLMLAEIICLAPVLIRPRHCPDTVHPGSLAQT